MNDDWDEPHSTGSPIGLFIAVWERHRENESGKTKELLKAASSDEERPKHWGLEDSR